MMVREEMEGDGRAGRKARRRTNGHGRCHCGRGTQAAPGRGGHVLLNEDLHQVDVAARGCRVQGRPQLVVLGVHVRTVGKQQLDNLFKVVNAALGGTQRQSEVRQGPCPGGDTSHTPHKGSQEEWRTRGLCLNPAVLLLCWKFCL